MKGHRTVPITNFYIWRNKSKTDYEVLFSIPLQGNKEMIGFIRSEINGVDGNAKELLDLYQSINEGYGNGSWSSVANQNGETNAGYDSVSSGKSSGEKQTAGNGRGNPGESNRDTSNDKVSSLQDSNDAKIKYALDANGMREDGGRFYVLNRKW